jgi:hypothetical protein
MHATGLTEERRNSMRPIAPFLAVVSLVMMATWAAAQPAKCKADKDAIDKARQAYDQADNAWQAWLKPLESALASKEAADKAYDMALKAAELAGAQFKLADLQFQACIESGQHQDCSVLGRKRDTARSEYSHAVDRLEEAFALAVTADNSWKDARAKEHDLLMKVKAAREALEKASTNYSRCLRGKPTFA